MRPRDLKEYARIVGVWHAGQVGQLLEELRVRGPVGAEGGRVEDEAAQRLHARGADVERAQEILGFARCRVDRNWLGGGKGRVVTEQGGRGSQPELHQARHLGSGSQSWGRNQEERGLVVGNKQTLSNGHNQMHECLNGGIPKSHDKQRKNKHISVGL